MRVGFGSLFAALLAGCAPQQPHTSTIDAPRSEVRVFTVSTAPLPLAGQLSRTTVHEGRNVVSQILRLSPGAEIAQHHHPAHDETFFVHTGSVEISLNGQLQRVSAGTIVHIPANTVIQGRNAGSMEVVLAVVFAATGAPGPLTVAGSPHH